MGFFSGLDDFFGGHIQRQRLERQRAKQMMDLSRRQDLRSEADQQIQLANAVTQLSQVARPVNQRGMVEQILSPQEQQMAANAGVVGMTSMERAPRGTTVSLPGNQQFELMSQDELAQRGNQYSVNRILAETQGRAFADQQARQTFGQPVQVGGREVQMLPQEVAKNVTALDRMSRRVSVPGLSWMGPVAPDEFNDAGSLLGRILPEYRSITNYETGDVRFAGVNPLTGQVDVKTAPELQGAAMPRPRQTPAPARQRGEAGGSTRSTRPTLTQRADEFIKQVIDESNAKGGTRPEDYLRNVEQFYADVPASVKAKARTYFRQMKGRSAQPQSQQGQQGQRPVPANRPPLSAFER